MIIDRVLVNRSIDFLNMLLIGMIMIAVFRSLIDAVRSFLLVHISIRLDSRLISMFMRHVWRLPMKFFDIRRTGDIVSRVAENDKIQETMSGAIPGLILDIVLATGYIFMLAQYNLKFTGIVLLIVPVLVILMILAILMILMIPLSLTDHQNLLLHLLSVQGGRRGRKFSQHPKIKNCLKK